MAQGCDLNVPLVGERPAETDPDLKAAFEGAENWAAHHAEQLLAEDEDND
jgi:hypothetical protein